VYSLELWKRAEEQKFKAYLKQREIERIEEITFTWRAKEQEREKQVAEALNRAAHLESRLRQKALDLQRREEKIVQLEEELKMKIQEVTRQLSAKEEEIMSVKKRFKEEKVLLEQDKKRLGQQLEEAKGRLEQVESKHYAFRKEVDESPISVLRQELGQKHLEMIELESRLKQAFEQRDDYQKKFEQAKKDMIGLKRA
jgi:centrosomal protein CEP120